MEQMIVNGGKQLRGRVHISGAKNAALPLMACSLLTDESLILERLPKLSDVRQMELLLNQHGVDIFVDRYTDALCELRLQRLESCRAPYEIVKKMRASILVLGPLVARHGRAEVSIPGGCAIGTRPVNVHIEGLRALGAEVHLDQGYICAEAPNGLTGAEITLPVASVTGTENLVMAAALARGTTILKNAAREPEVANLCECLVAMGARITGIGSSTLTLEGVPSLHGAKVRVIPDRIEAATYAVAAAITHGDLDLEGVQMSHLSCFWEALRKAGASVEPVTNEDIPTSVRVHLPGELWGVDVMTEPYPGFPTDAQAQFMALMTLCQGAALITETIFENRFMHVLELCRLNADITVHHASALVRGKSELVGAPVMATDLRASVSLILAGLAAKGETIVQRIYHIDRGYEQVEEKLRACGADIERVQQKAA